MIDIQPKLLTFYELVQGRLFRIPEYQRAYSWERKQRQDLFGDIRKTHENPAAEHFMATVVCLRRDARTIHTDRFLVMEVVDGQQRLTTLVLLLKAIELRLDRDKEDERMVSDDIRKLLVKADELAPVLLQTNHDSSDYCPKYLREGGHPASTAANTLADRLLLQAMEESEVFVSKWIADGSPLVDLVTLVKNRLKFILHEIGDEALVYSVFEVLNSRGLEVSWFDRLKSALMGLAFEVSDGNATETIDELHQIWQRIYARVGLRLGLSTEALRFAATLLAPTQPRRPISEADAVEALRKACKGTAKGTVDISNWILQVTEAVDKLHADVRLSAVTEIVQARLLATALQLRDDLSEATRQRTLQAWERVSFRIYGMCRKDSRFKVGDYVRLAWRCYHDRPSAETLLKEIHGLGKEYPIDKAIEELSEIDDCYHGWEVELRYFLFRYEEWLAKQRGQKFANEQWARIWMDTPARSIEHIMPQSSGAHYVNWLGNLLLLPPGLNSKLNASKPEAKANAYRETGLAIAAEVAERIPPWDEKAVKTRDDELFEWAREEWSDDGT